MISNSKPDLELLSHAGAVIGQAGAASLIASALRPAWTWSLVAPMPVLSGDDQKLITANHKAGTNDEMRLLSEHGAAVRKQR